MQSVYYVIRDIKSRFSRDSDESLVSLNNELFFHSKIEADSAFMSANLPSSQYRVEKFEV